MKDINNQALTQPSVIKWSIKAAMIDICNKGEGDELENSYKLGSSAQKCPGVASTYHEEPPVQPLLSKSFVFLNVC
jgi:hypothetical protein